MCDVLGLFLSNSWNYSTTIRKIAVSKACLHACFADVALIALNLHPSSENKCPCFGGGGGGKRGDKFSHTRYWALGPELIPVYRQSARRWREVSHAINQAVGCHYFPPGLRLPSQSLAGLLYQLIPLGDGSTWVWAACWRLLSYSSMAGNWTHAVETLA